MTSDFDSWASELADTISKTKYPPCPDDMDIEDWEELCESREYPCRVCGNVVDINCEPHEFDVKMHYCGGSPRCCP